jgi:glucose/arabinose dehydrogenase
MTLRSGLDNPTNIEFAADGRIFVAEKSGRIKVFDGPTDTTATLFADLNVNVHNFWDRGLLGLALHPSFPANPSVYVLYAYDHVLGTTTPAPRWCCTTATAPRAATSTRSRTSRTWPRAASSPPTTSTRPTWS